MISTIQQKLLLHTFGSLPINIKWLFDGQKVTPDLSDVVIGYNNLLHADKCFLYTSAQILSMCDTPVLASGTKGFLNIELMARTTNVSLETQYGAVIPNIWDDNCSGL